MTLFHVERKSETFIRLSLLLSLIFSVAFPDEDSTSSMKCICDGNCERVEESECPSGLTLDVCGCCVICARGENEPCGGAAGNCAIGLDCDLPEGNEQEDSSSERNGICKRNSTNCASAATVQKFGCIVHFGECVCKTWTGCSSEQKLFLFNREEDCKTRVAFLITQNQIGKNGGEKTKSTTTMVKADAMGRRQWATSGDEGCSGVQCKDAPACPVDSHRNPIIISHEGHQSRKFRSSSNGECCATIKDICQCNPSSACSPKPICSTGSTARIVVNATTMPGMCCPIYECISNSNITAVAETEAVEYTDSESESTTACWFKGMRYASEESWTNEEDCSECTCFNRLSKCKGIQCQHPDNCKRIIPITNSSSCCPICSDCVSSSGVEYSHSDIWQEDSCTICKCNYGRKQCHSTLCSIKCLRPKYIEGECCPYCDGEEDTVKFNSTGINRNSSNREFGGVGIPSIPDQQIQLHFIIITVAVFCLTILISTLFIYMLRNWSHGSNHRHCNTVTREELGHKTASCTVAVPLTLSSTASTRSRSNKYCYKWFSSNRKDLEQKTPLQNSSTFSESVCESEKAVTMESV